MSKGLVYDALLVRALAAELQERYGGQRVRSIRFDTRARMLHVFFRRLTLEWNLDPANGWLIEIPASRMAGLQLPAGTQLTAIHVRPDDRVMQWVLRAETADGEREIHLWLELLPQRRAAVVATPEGVRLYEGAGAASTLTYAPPEHRPRPFADARPHEAMFVARLQAVPGAERERALLQGFAWTSPLNAAAILQDDGDEAGRLSRAWQRYCRIVAGPTEPVLLEGPSLAQPYPVPLPGIAARPFPTLLEAFAAARERPAMPMDRAAVLAALEKRRRFLENRIARLEQEARDGNRQAAEYRRMADLLLSRAAKLPRGQSEIELQDWEGNTVRVPLDPAFDGAGNANRLYELARKRERAATRVPALIEEAVQARGRLADTIARLERGEISVEEAAKRLPAPPAVKPEARSPRLPYRRFRTGGGLEVRVGRHSRSNDELTLHHSSPEDIWLHARDAAGAHVVLRWSKRDENPPASDLVEAAALAALHSRAATSSVVAVDWTRRKYVRKPRRAPPGLVLVERAKTIFVEPDPALAKRLRVE